MGGARTAFWPRGMATLAVPIFLIQYAGQPFPGSMIAKETGLELPDLLVLGQASLFLRLIKRVRRPPPDGPGSGGGRGDTGED